MKTYYGNYLGIVITGGEKDPEGRGRCQVFVPHIMPALYEGWNKEGEDIKFDIVGNGLPTALKPEIIQTLQKTLPWAECAAPIVGSSPSVKDGDEIKRNTARAMSIVGGLGPVVNLENSFEGAVSETPGAAATYIRNTPWSAGFISYVAGVNSSSFPRAGMHTTYATAVRNSQAPGWIALDPSTTQVRPGDIVIKNRAGNSLSWGGSWTGPSHGDIVTSVSNNTIKTVGGNVGDSVSVTNVPASNGIINRSNYFAILRPPVEVANNIANIAEQEFNKWSTNGWNERSSGALGTLASYYDAGNLQVPPGVNPSAIAGGPIPVGTNMDQPPNNQPNYDVPPSIDTSNMSPDFKTQYDRVYGALEGSKFIGTIPEDGAKYGIVTGSREEWAHMFTRLASTESSFNASVAADINGGRSGPLTSFGLYQLGTTQFNRHGGGDIYNPDDNTNAFVNYAEEMYFGNTYGSGGNNVIGARGGSNGWLGLAAAYGPIRRITDGRPDENQKQLLAENISAAERQTGDYTANNLASKQQSVQRPTQHSASPGPNTNYQALGMFGYASEGTAVWVFFREGDPHFPVYFAASYGQREWQNMYSYSSPGIGAGAGTGALPGTEKMRLNSYGGGFESIQVSENSESGLDPQFTFQVYGKNGSNLLFTKDHTELNSTYNHNQRVAGDFQEITEANKEERVRGDKNSYVEQDIYITIGNWTDEAIAASDEIQQYINEAMEIKSNAGKA